MTPKSNGHSDDRSQERLIDLMAEYHAALTDGKPFAAAADTAQLDADSRVAFARAQRVLERLARVRPQFAAGDATKSVAASDGIELTNGRPFAAAPSDATTHLPKNFGRFEIVSELGHGGLGVVLLARDPVLGRSVALKIPRADALFTHDLRQRFAQSASGRPTDAPQSGAGL